MDILILGVFTPIVILLLYIVYEIVKYNPSNTNTTKPLEDEDDNRTDN